MPISADDVARAKTLTHGEGFVDRLRHGEPRDCTRTRIESQSCRRAVGSARVIAIAFLSAYLIVGVCVGVYQIRKQKRRWADASLLVKLLACSGFVAVMSLWWLPMHLGLGPKSK